MKISAPSKRVVSGGIFMLVLSGFFVESAIAGCRSYAYDKKDAIVYCTKELGCKPSQIVACYGRTNEWKCRCETPKEDVVHKIEQEKDSDYSINKDRDKSSPKLLEDK